MQDLMQIVWTGWDVDEMMIIVQYPCTVKIGPVPLYCEDWASTVVLWAVIATDCSAKRRVRPSPRLQVGCRKNNLWTWKRKITTYILPWTSARLHFSPVCPTVIAHTATELVWVLRMVRMSQGKKNNRAPAPLILTILKLQDPPAIQLQDNKQSVSGLRMSLITPSVQGLFTHIGKWRKLNRKKGKNGTTYGKTEDNNTASGNQRTNRSCVIDNPKSTLDAGVTPENRRRPKTKKLGNQKGINSTFSRMNYP